MKEFEHKGLVTRPNRQLIIKRDRLVFSVNYFCRSATIIFAGCRQVDV